MFSQNDEERIILEYFGNFKGVFAEIGANDGITFSNTYALAEMGWAGVCIEPSPKAFKKLSELYKDRGNIDLYNVALGAKTETVILSESSSLESENDIGLVSTLKDSEKERFKDVVTYGDVEVQCWNWELFMHITPLTDFNFISMDIEGSELDVLPHMDLSKTRLICLEWNLKEELKTEYEKYLSGFSLIHTTPENLIYGRM